MKGSLIPLIIAAGCIGILGAGCGGGNGGPNGCCNWCSCSATATPGPSSEGVLELPDAADAASEQ
jgi:hypothetical protein